MDVGGFLWDNAEKIGALSTAVAVIFSAFALGFGAGQIAAGRSTQREATAKEVWRSFEQLSFENPKLSFPREAGIIAEDGTVNGDLEERTRYLWYVSIMMLACEEVLTSYGGRGDWAAAVEAQFVRHQLYLRSAHFRESVSLSSASPRLRDALKRALGA